LSATLVGIGYGGNDAEKAVGLFAFVGAWSTAAGRRAATAGHLPIPAWAVWAAVGTFTIGMAVGGIRMARTVGFRFYPIRSTDAVATQLACGLTVLVAGSLGEPVSTTQTSTAAMLASGAARRLSLPRWLVVSEMVLSWLIALPLGLVSGGVLTMIVRLAGGMR
jgi:PiT family inorganic phosphate transporter